MYAQVAVNRPVQQAFHYKIPAELVDKLQLGHLVEVEFGTARLSGIVVGFDDDSPVPETKPVRRLLDSTPVVTLLQLQLAEWLATTTMTPIGACLWLMLPPGLTGQSVTRYTLLEPDDPGNTTTQKRVLNLLKRRGPLTSHQLERSLPRQNWRAAVNQLLRRQTIGQEQIFRPPQARPKHVRSARLAIPIATIPDIAIHLGNESRRANVLEVLLTAPDRSLPLSTLTDLAGCSDAPVKTLAKDETVAIEAKHVRLLCSSETAHARIMELRNSQPYLDVLNLLATAKDGLDASTIYAQTGTNLSHLRRLAEADMIILGEMEVWRDPLADLSVAPQLPPPLTSGQQAVWDQIQPYIDRHHWRAASKGPSGADTFLLHGVTGSGKTEIYLRATERTLAQGRQAIILVPEIALTAQLIDRFAARFPERLAVIHSRLSSGERYDTWRRIRQGEVDIVIGARSALFVPLPDPGLIVLDEEHDDSYKQSPPVTPPYYHTRDTAIQAMRLNGGIVILGSATPDLTTMYRAKQSDYHLLELPDRIIAHRDKIKRQTEYLNLPEARYLPTDASEAVSADLPPVEIVDMRQELRAGNRSIFSRLLQDKLAHVLSQGQQALLFLNRRGTATFVMCRDCGHIVLCSNCDTPMTYHRTQEALLCHYCGHQQPNPVSCIVCGSERIRHFGAGTEQVHRTLEEMYPQARVLRWDQDTASQKGAHETILRRFMNREADILVGTQMIAKGLDIPLVTLVGIISADTSLGLPDYRNGERTFQLLTQVAGRAGRGVLGGEVIMQTYQPENYAVQAAAEHDYHAFYAQEVAYRQSTQYPPFVRLARLLFRNRNPAQVEHEARAMAVILHDRVAERHLTATEIIGPTPCFFIRLEGVFRWQILVRTTNPVAVFDGIDLGQDVMLDIDPVDTL